MKDMRTYLSVLAAGLFAAVLAGCTKTEEIYIDEMYQKAYITSDFYPQNESALCVINDSYTDPYLEVRNNRVVYSPGFLRTVSGSAHSSVNFRTIYSVKKDLTATLVVAEDAVSAYNDKLGLAEEEAYQLLPAGYYTLKPEISTIKAGKNQGEEAFSVEISERTEGLANGRYLIPLTVRLDGPIALSTARGLYYIPLHFTSEDLRAGTSDVPSNLKLLVHNTDFTVEETTAAENLNPGWGITSGFYGSGGQNGMTTLFDNNGSTTTGTQVAQASLNVTFTEPVRLDRMCIRNTMAFDATYQQKPYEVWISCLYEGETAFSEAVTVMCEDADTYWFDGSGFKAGKRIAQMSITVADEMTSCSDICFIALADEE